jgi:hypothetical protein
MGQTSVIYAVEAISRASAFDPLRTFTPSEMLALMTDVDRQWSLSNPGPDELLVWLEPGAEEFAVPARSTIALRASSETGEGVLDEVEWTADYLALWASTPGTLKVFVDGELQDSASALVPIPEGMTRQMLNVVFADQPAARLGGRHLHVVERTSWWQRVRLRLGL